MFVAMFVAMFVVMRFFALMVVVHVVRVNNGTLGGLKIFEFGIFIGCCDIEATDIAFVRNKLDLTVVDTLSLHAQNALRLAEVLAGDGVIHHIHNAANGAVRVEQGGRTLYYFDLFDIKQIHIHAVICS